MRGDYSAGCRSAVAARGLLAGRGVMRAGIVPDIEVLLLAQGLFAGRGTSM